MIVRRLSYTKLDSNNKQHSKMHSLAANLCPCWLRMAVNKSISYFELIKLLLNDQTFLFNIIALNEHKNSLI